MDYVQHKWINPNTIEDRDYQQRVLETALKGNTLCVIPTGLGKTNIAALVAAHRLEKDMNKKIMFLAPTRPLVEQHRQTFSKFMKIGESELKVITGFNKPEERGKLYKKADVVFSTPQTVRNDLKKGTVTMDDYSLLVIDEAHRCVGNYAYPYIAKVYMNQAKDPLILGLTASPGSQRYKIEEVCDKLFIDNVEIRTRDDGDVKKYIQKMDYNREEVELTNELKEVKNLLDEIKQECVEKLNKWNILHTPFISKTQAIALQQKLARKRSGMGYAAMSILAEILKIDHALTLLETQCLGSMKMYVDGFEENKTKAVARLLKEGRFIKAMSIIDNILRSGKEHPKIEKLKEIVKYELSNNKYTGIIVFAQYRDTISAIKESLKDIKHAAPVEFIGQQKKKGRGLSQKEQVEILNEFKMGFYNILIASQVGEEGLDIEETNIVIFYDTVPSAVRRIQRTGRTARTKPGKVIVMMTKGTRDEAYHWSGHHKEKKMKKILYSMQKNKDLRSFR